MAKIRSRRVAVWLMAWTLPLIGAIGVLAPGHVRVKGISPTCLLVPQDQGCEGGIIS